MILLDTNVLSAMMRLTDEPLVERWLDAQPAESVWTTAITIFEIRLGLALLARGRRWKQLDAAFTRAVDEVLDGRVLIFDQASAEAAAEIAAAQREAGQTAEIRDVQIAGIARARKATIATRNIRHFSGLGISLADPWRT